MFGDTASCLALTNKLYKHKYFNIKKLDKYDRGKEMGIGFHSARYIVGIKINTSQRNE